MSTVIRPELSKKNKYWIGKHRYYELKHFCLQYKDWVKKYEELQDIHTQAVNYRAISVDCERNINQVEKTALYLAATKDKIELVEATSKLAGGDISKWLLKAVTEGLSYTYLSNVMDIPCSRDMYYDRYRKFFYILSKVSS